MGQAGRRRHAAVLAVVMGTPPAKRVLVFSLRRAAIGGAAVCVLMYICFRLARMIAQPDHLIVRPNLGGSRNHGSAVGSTALGSPYRRRVSYRRLHCTMVRQRQNKL